MMMMMMMMIMIDDNTAAIATLPTTLNGATRIHMQINITCTNPITGMA